MPKLRAVSRLRTDYSAKSSGRCAPEGVHLWNTVAHIVRIDNGSVSQPHEAINAERDSNKEGI